MRFLTADYLFPLHIAPIKKGVLQISEKGEVVEIFVNREAVPQSQLEIFKGILCPGFVNAHCHLELSHLKGMAKKGKGLLDFITAVHKRNNFAKENFWDLDRSKYDIYYCDLEPGDMLTIIYIIFRSI